MSASEQNGSEKFAQANKVDRVEPISADVYTSEGNRNNDLKFDATTTLGSTDETYIDGNIKSTHLRDTESESEIHEPKTYEDACKDSRWIDAMNLRMEALNRNGTWTITDLLKGIKAIELEEEVYMKLPDGYFDKSDERVLHCLSQVMHASTKGNLKSIFKVLRYLKGSSGLGLNFKPGRWLDLNVYVDSDWARFFLGDNLVSWKSTKLSILAKSSADD
nr:ribonuclease H-like domain-containing protein [Tanacetum cinerariifolium]